MTLTSALPTFTSTPGPTDLVEKAGVVGADLAESLRRLMAAVPGAPHRPTTLARRLGLSRVIVSRILNSLERPTPIEFLYDLPGPESLRAILRAAAEQDVDAPVADAAGRAIDRFDRLIRDDFGTRAALEALLSTRYPRTRERFNASSRHEVFSGMSRLIGVQADVWVTTMLFHPTRNSRDQLDVAAIHGALALRYLRPGASAYFRFGTGTAVAEPSELQSFDLRQYYRNAAGVLRDDVSGDEKVHILVEHPVGRQSLIDVMVADYRRSAMPRFSAPVPRNKRGATVLPDVPVKMLAFDVLLHHDVFPGAQPELVVYNACLRGPAGVNDPRRDLDRMPVQLQLESLGSGVASFHSDDIPNYVAMLTELCRRLEWDPASFRGWRCRVQYPVYGWQTFMTFDGPLDPGT
jgi:hypothetical protein